MYTTIKRFIMSKNVKINRHPFLSDNIIYSAIKELNFEFKTKIDPEQFFDSVTSNFCSASLEKSSLNLTFPVVATTEYAHVIIPVSNGMPSIKETSFNKAFEKEITRNKD